MKIVLTEKSYLILEDGKLHNTTGPAWVHEDGTEEYYIDGKLHREDGPARIFLNGKKEIWFHGVYQGTITPDGLFHSWK